MLNEVKLPRKVVGKELARVITEAAKEEGLLDGGESIVGYEPGSVKERVIGTKLSFLKGVCSSWKWLFFSGKCILGCHRLDISPLEKEKEYDSFQITTKWIGLQAGLIAPNDFTEASEASQEYLKSILNRFIEGIYQRVKPAAAEA